MGDNGITGQYGFAQWDSLNDYYRIETDGTNGFKIKGNNVSIGNIFPAEPLIIGSGNTELLKVTSVGRVGIGTTNPEFKLSLDTDGGIVAKGDFGSGTILATTGSGTRFVWYPRKSAFRAGHVSSIQWNDANIGNHSIAMGNDIIVNGVNSTAIGTGIRVSGWYSTAIGLYVNAGSADNAIVLGRGVNPINPLVNNSASSLMIGFNSNIPTFFVGSSAGVGTTGNVGIGTASPNAKLQVVDGDIAITTQSNGIILRATDGPNCFRVTVNNTGTLSTNLVSCP